MTYDKLSKTSEYTTRMANQLKTLNWLEDVCDNVAIEMRDDKRWYVTAFVTAGKDTKKIYRHGEHKWFVINKAATAAKKHYLSQNDSLPNPRLSER